MRKWVFRCFLVVFLCFVFFQRVNAVDYTIDNFESQIRLEQDSSLTITENITTNFMTEKHGIFRIVPFIYSRNGKTIRADIKVLGVRDENGNKISYTVENYNQSKKIKIGDANKLVNGIKNYFITYSIKGVILDLGEGPEVYWNVTGEEWEVPIKKASAKIDSPFGRITKINCFGCDSSFTDSEAEFEGEQGLTIVAQIDSNNLIKMPGVFEKRTKELMDNFGYLIAIFPSLLMFFLWYNHGRDKKYLTENVFYEPKDKIEKNTPLINRPHLPLVYGPIDGLTPSQVGTIVDEKFDTKDAVAEIVELARLGYITIKKEENKGFFGITNRDYILTITDKPTENLKDYQQYLLESLFSVYIGFKQKKLLDEQIFKTTGRKAEALTVKISDLKNNFYKHLKELREKVYQEMTTGGMFIDDPEATRALWVVVAIILNGITFFGLIVFFTRVTGNDGPIPVLLLGIIPSLILARKMPRKTAKGYSLHRQAVGLKYYLSKGKWREDIAEKQLFLEEMLPLAITLGVVEQLANDMKLLGVEPPKYFEGMTMNTFVYDLSNFSASTASGLTTAPSNYSGSGTWSGGSGFSGGFSGGGGFGGGGGGSW